MSNRLKGGLDEEQDKPTRVQQFLVGLVLVVMGLALVYSGISFVRALSSTDGKWNERPGIEWLAAIVASGYAFITGFQWLTLNSTLSLGRETARRQLRAYVVARTVTVELVRDGTTNKISGLACRVTFFNAGQTPAYDVQPMHSAAVHTFVPDPVLPDLSTPAFRTTAVLGPRVEHLDDLGTGLSLDENQVTALQRGLLAVYVWGEVQYRDIYDTERRTWFATRWPRIPGRIEDRGTIACTRGNGAT